MAQPFKGPRGQIMVRPTLPVYEAIRARATERGLPMSQFCADMLAAAMGMPDEVRDLGAEVLPLAM